MGGEPTFVSMDDPDGAEWNFTAVSHKKRILSGELIKRLRENSRPARLLHYGQGKWYPGEPLPRWALGAYLAQGRRADLEGRFAHRRRIEKLRPRPEGSEGTRDAPCQNDWRGSETSDSRLRGRLLLHLEGTPFSDERHAGKIQSQGQAGTRTHRAHFPAGPRRSRRLRAADQARVAWQ